MLCLRQLLIDGAVGVAHLLHAVAAAHAAVAGLPHAGARIAVRRDGNHGVGDLLDVHRRGEDAGRAEIVPFAVDQAAAVAHVRGDARLLRGKTLEDHERLALADAREDQRVHAADVLLHADAAGEHDVLHVQRFHELKALLRVFPVLLPGAHDPELQTRVALLGVIERVDQRLDVLDRRHADGRADVDHRIVRLLAGHMGKARDVHAVRRDARLLPRAAEIELQAARVLEQGGHEVRPLVGAQRHLAELLDPEIFIDARDPLGLDDLLLPLTRVDAVLRNEQRAAVFPACQAAHDAGIPGGHAVIEIGFHGVVLQREAQRQIDGAQRPQEIGKHDAAIAQLIHLLGDLQEIGAHKEAVERELLFLKQAEDRLPVHGIADDKAAHGLELRAGKPVPEAGARPPALPLAVVQINFPHLRDIRRQLVGKLPALFPARNDGRDGKFQVRKLADEAVHPAGHTAHHIGVAPFGNEADLHGRFTPFPRTRTDPAAAASRRPCPL